MGKQSNEFNLLAGLNIDSISFKYEEHRIKNEKDWGGVSSDGSRIIVTANRHGCDDCAKWFNNSVGNDGTKMIHTEWGSNVPQKLNFAIKGILTINSNKFEVCIGQGHHERWNGVKREKSNNWHIASKSITADPDGKNGMIGGNGHYYSIRQDGVCSFKLSIARNKWMECLEQEYHIGDLKLKQLAIPGTHDSGTAIINADSARGPDYPSTTAPAQIVAEWAKAQDLTVEQQLQQGIRFLDIRACINEQGEFYTSHAMIGESIAEILDSVLNFVKHNTKEIVILDFRKFNNVIDEPDHDKLIEKINNKLSSWIIPSERFSPNSTLNELKGHGNIIISYNCKYAKNILWGPKFTSDFKWAQIQDTKNLKAKLENLIDEHNFENNTFFILPGVITPKLHDIMRRLIPFITDNSLKKYTQPATKAVTSWLKSDPKLTKNVNIITADFINTDDFSFVDEVIQININRGHK